MPILTKPVAHYKLEDNTSNTTVTDSAGSFTGTCSQNTNQMDITGKILNGFYFLGNIWYYINLPNILTGSNTQFTFCCWVYFPQILQQDWSYILDMANLSIPIGGFGFTVQAQQYTGNTTVSAAVHTAGWQSCTAGSGGYSNPGLNFTNTWTWVCCTCLEYNYIKLYYNNVQVGQVNFGYAFSSPTGSGAKIGKCRYSLAGNPQQPYKGGLDDIRFYDRILTHAEMSAIYNNGNGTQNQIIGPFPTNI